MAKELSKAALRARRKYQRESYRQKKEQGALPQDRYTPEERAEYNRRYREGKRGAEIMRDYWERKAVE